ncbi:MAG: glycosyl hydrolase family 28 protein [Oscillospiraceae bacterium]|nr:glycosyl hydrolase family 28 protein [Oscillospiraceae bacterium]
MNCKITDFGAVGDGETLCTNAFNKTVEAVYASGGGYAEVPPGKYVSGSIRLLSNVYLRLCPGAKILGSRCISDYTAPQRLCKWHPNGFDGFEGINYYGKDNTPGCKCHALIYADRAVNTGIVGEGIIDGRRGRDFPVTHEAGRPFLAVFSECEHVKVTDVTLKNSGLFAFYGLNSKRVMIDHVTVLTAHSANGDGLDFDGGRDVVISNCILETGDDSIGLKTLTAGEPCENFVITNCVFRSLWAGIRLGPETAADMRNITVSNCVFDSCNDGLKIQVCNDITFEDLQFTNLSMKNVVRPIFMTNNHFNMSCDVKTARPASGRLRRVLFSGIHAVMTKREGDALFEGYNAITGLFNAPIEDITLRDVRLIAHGTGTAEQGRRSDVPELLEYRVFYPEAPAYKGVLPAANLYIKNAANVHIADCTFDCANFDGRYSVCAENAQGLKITGTKTSNSAGLLRYIECDGLETGGCAKDAVEFTPEESKIWHDNMAQMKATDAVMAREAAEIDKIRSCV